MRLVLGPRAGCNAWGLTRSLLRGTLILASLHLPDDAIRLAGLTLLVLVGLGLLLPPLGHLLERPFYRFPQRFTGVLAVALTFNISDIIQIQRDIPNCTQAVGKLPGEEGGGPPGRR